MLDTAQALPHLAYYVFAVQSEVALFPALSGKGAMFRCAIARRVVLASWASREHAGLFWGFGNGTFCWMGLIQAPRTDALETMRTRMPFSQFTMAVATRNLAISVVTFQDRGRATACEDAKGGMKPPISLAPAERPRLAVRACRFLEPLVLRERCIHRLRIPGTRSKKSKLR